MTPADLSPHRVRVRGTLSARFAAGLGCSLAPAPVRGISVLVPGADTDPGALLCRLANLGVVVDGIEPGADHGAHGGDDRDGGGR